MFNKIKCIFATFVFTLLAGCGGGGSGAPSAPSISNLTYSPTTTTASTLSFNVTGSVTISASADLTTLKIVDSRGNTISSPITGAAGFRDGTIKVPAATIVGNPAGLYTFTVSVIDVNGLESNKLTGQIDIKRAKITANAGPDLAIYPNSSTSLVGLASNPNGTQTSYKWTLLKSSPGSLGVLSNSTNANARFTPSTTGVYELGLQVSDSVETSEVDTVKVLSIPVGKFSLGSSITDLTAVQGPPTGFGPGGRYEYDRLGFTYVSINSTCKCVTGWSNFDRTLNQIMLSSGFSTDGKTSISLTSTYDDVIRIQGTPVQYDVGSSYTFYYDTLGFTFIQVSLTTGLVVGWRNFDGTLKLQ